MLYLCLLTILYLGLGYQAERILREKQHVTEQLEEAVAEEKPCGPTSSLTPAEPPGHVHGRAAGTTHHPSHPVARRR